MVVEQFMEESFSLAAERTFLLMLPNIMYAEKNDLFAAICCILGADRIYEEPFINIDDVKKRKNNKSRKNNKPSGWKIESGRTK